MVLEMAEAALSPWRAYQFFEHQRKTWGYAKDPEEACRFCGRNPKVKNLVWC